MKRIPFDSLCLAAVARETADSLNGGFIQGVRNPDPVTLALEVRKPGSTRHLMLTANPDFPCAYLASSKSNTLPEPTAFCMACRKHLEGAQIDSIEQVDFDRILALRFKHNGHPIGTLTVELMGKHSNLILTDHEGEIIDSAIRVSSRMSRIRTIVPGRKYTPPPPTKGAHPLELTKRDLETILAEDEPSDLASRLIAHVGGLSPFLANSISILLRQSPTYEAWRTIFDPLSSGRWSPVHLRNPQGELAGAYPIAIPVMPDWSLHPRESYSTALETALAASAQSSVLADARGTGVDRIRVELNYLRRELAKLEPILADPHRADRQRESGELLLANAHRIPAEATSVTVEDYYHEGLKRIIELDPVLTAVENAQMFFKLASKEARRLQVSLQRKQAIEDRLRKLLAAQAELSAVDSPKQAEEIILGLEQSGVLKTVGSWSPNNSAPAAGPRFPGFRIRSIQTEGGYEILFGENATSNDHLTTRVASPNDWWLHVRGSTSAHVVVRTGGAPDRVPKSVLQQAAIISAKHSAAKHSSTVPVDYVLKKHVRKPRKSAPGTVVYQNEKTLHVNPVDD